MITIGQKNVIIIMVAISTILIMISIFVIVNKSKVDSCSNKEVYVLNTGVDIEKEDIKESFEKTRSNYSLGIYNPKMESSSIKSVELNQLVKDLSRIYNMYDSFVILVNNNAIDYISSFLSFMLDNLSKPIIVTDYLNLSNAIKLSSDIKINEVLQLQNNKIIRGNHGKTGLELTDSTSLNIDPESVFKPLYLKDDLKIGSLKIYPGFNSKQLYSFKDYDALVIELYDTTAIYPSILDILEKLSNNGTIIICTPSLNDKIDQIISVNMTPESAFAKISVLLSNIDRRNYDKEQLSKLMDLDLKGEIIVINEFKLS